MDNQQEWEDSPKNFAANQFMATFGPREIGLILGQARHIIQRGENDIKGQRIEWHASFSLSPITAKQMLEALTQVLQAYEEKFGKIPSDPAGTIQISDFQTLGK